jgi:thiamine monophosphate synthase
LDFCKFLTRSLPGFVVVQGKVSEQAAVQEEMTALQMRNKELEELEAAAKVRQLCCKHTVRQRQQPCLHTPCAGRRQ